MSESGDLSTHDSDTGVDTQVFPSADRVPATDPVSPFFAASYDTDSCPLKNNTFDFTACLQQGDRDQAIRELYQVNPLPQICTYACQCDHPDCMRKRAIASSHGQRNESVYEVIDHIDHDVIIDIIATNRSRFMTGRRVAIIGSGASALTAAYDLVIKGHHVVIYEATDRPGGSLRVKADRQPGTATRLDEDIDVILSLGIDLRLNMAVGQHITMDKLHINFDAVLDTTCKAQPTDASEDLTASRLWSIEDQGGIDCTLINQAIASGHRVAEDIHDAMLARMWKRA